MSSKRQTKFRGLLLGYQVSKYERLKSEYANLVTTKSNSCK
ncbi:unnamed protein product [Acanthoscelides obtectus]|uniref:Uncharacterized protein n=1 Tax=Acanthoscelides obtectus TaxID=200917 RepID=A0A9P0NV16_ACAOB|nr:unnamed protein product [Acanthoscelides obtectus]CAK1666985.1 hypothetical protein AOBTE_LOCUS25598 [Acanthoscelides obtectus]